MTDINATLAERGNNYGEFDDNARTTESMKLLFRRSPSWPEMQPYHHEALDMIAHKISRLLNGDPDFIDSWVDIAGYAQCAVNSINKNQIER